MLDFSTSIAIGDVADAECSSIMHATKVISTACRTFQNTKLHSIPILTESTNLTCKTTIIQLKEALRWGRAVTTSIT